MKTNKNALRRRLKIAEKQARQRGEMIRILAKYQAKQKSSLVRRAYRVMRSLILGRTN